MPSLFAALEDRLSDTIDHVFGEPFEFRPYVAVVPNVRPAADNSRAVRPVFGAFDEPSFNSTEVGTDVRGGSRFSMRKPSLSIDVRQFLAGQKPQRLDRLLRIDTGKVYEVSDVKQDGEGRYKLMLHEVSTS